MRRALSRLRYFAVASWGGMRASPVTSLVSIFTIGVTLLLMGGFLLMLQNMEAVLEGFGKSLTVGVYLYDDVSDDDTVMFKVRFASIEGVSQVEFISKQEALRRFQARSGVQADLLEGLGENPLPASFELRLEPSWRSKEKLERVASEITGIPGIEEVTYGGQWAEGYARFIELARIVSAALGGVLGFATLLIVANTIQLAIYARRDELEILALVGASRLFANMPFLLEGFLQGLLGGVLALSLLYTLFRLLLPSVVGGWAFLLGSVPPQFLSASGMTTLIATGSLLGILGSALALATRKRA